MTHEEIVEEMKKEPVTWQDGMIVEFMAYPMHHNEGGGEELGNELEVFQRGIVLGDTLVGCDFELQDSDFTNGIYEDGTQEGGYRVDEYIKGVLVKPDWVDTLITTTAQRLKADWLRSEIERLEGMAMKNTKDESTSDWFYGYGWNHALTTLITRYKEELKVLESK